MKIALFGSANPSAKAQVEQILTTIPNVTWTDGPVGADHWVTSQEPVEDFPASASLPDMALSIGGDGTFLRTAARIGQSGIPILGVNAGHLGFLSDMQMDEAAEALPEILGNGRYDVEGRSLIELEIPECRQPYQSFALNEVAILKRDVSAMVSVSVWVDGSLLNQYDADGLAIATPTGSTAYAMSAGGPILSPQCDCFVIVPIAPHSLTTRPLVIPDNCQLEIGVKSRNGLFLVAIDGLPLHLTTEYRLILHRAPHQVNVVRRRSRTFYDTLRKKLMWGLDGRYAN